MPGGLVSAPVLEQRRDEIVALLEDVGRHLAGLALLTLDRKATAIQFGVDVLDDYRLHLLKQNVTLPLWLFSDEAHPLTSLLIII